MVTLGADLGEFSYLRCFLLLFKILLELLRVAVEEVQNTLFCVALLFTGSADWKPCVDNLFYFRQIENPSPKCSLSQLPPH